MTKSKPSPARTSLGVCWDITTQKAVSHPFRLGRYATTVWKANNTLPHSPRLRAHSANQRTQAAAETKSWCKEQLKTNRSKSQRHLKATTRGWSASWQNTRPPKTRQSWSKYLKHRKARVMLSLKRTLKTSSTAYWRSRSLTWRLAGCRCVSRAAQTSQHRSPSEPTAMSTTATATRQCGYKQAPWRPKTGPTYSSWTKTRLPSAPKSN